MTTVPARDGSGPVSTRTGHVRSTWRAVALPSEHGGWSLTLEPAVLGLLVAWSWSGFALAVAALVAFLARTPLKLVLVDRWRGRWLPRTTTAGRIAAAEIGLLVVLLGLAALGSSGRFWTPLVLATPLLMLELWFDMRSRSRRLLPELAGTIGIGSVTAAIALAGGAGAPTAVALWVVVAARAVAAMPYARTQVRRAHGRPADPRPSDIAQAVAVALIIGGWALGDVPAASVLVLLTVVVANLVAMRRPPRPIVFVGLEQMLVGMVLVVVTGVALR